MVSVCLDAKASFLPSSFLLRRYYLLVRLRRRSPREVFYGAERAFFFLNEGRKNPDLAVSAGRDRLGGKSHGWGGRLPAARICRDAVSSPREGRETAFRGGGDGGGGGGIERARPGRREKEGRNPKRKLVLLRRRRLLRGVRRRRRRRASRRRLLSSGFWRRVVPRKAAPTPPPPFHAPPGVIVSPLRGGQSPPKNDPTA